MTSDRKEFGYAQIFPILRSSRGVRQLELAYLRKQQEHQQSANTVAETDQVNEHESTNNTQTADYHELWQQIRSSFKRLVSKFCSKGSQP